MKTLIPIFIVLSVLLLLSACSIENERMRDPGEFKFTYNGTDYHITPYSPNVEVISNGKDHINIRIPGVFGGEIYFDINSCAYLAPELTTIYKDVHCNLTSRIDGLISPIDSSKVFTYQSGSLNLTISDCITNTEEYPHPDGGSSHTTSSCRASGTFDLTLVNKNNETIEITNGIIHDFPTPN